VTTKTSVPKTSVRQTPAKKILVVEDDVFLRLIEVVLDPSSGAERRAAFADYFAHDEPDFEGWCARVRMRAGDLVAADVRLVETKAELRANLADADAVVVESLALGGDEFAAAPRLKVVQKYGVGLRNIDTEAAAARGIKILTLRRRANIACAEHAVGLMLAQAKMTTRLAGHISVEALAKLGYHYHPFDRRHTPNSNWARIPGVRMLHDATLGIIGLGEIGREIALRAASFGMRVLYTQRRQLAAAEESTLQITYASLDTLLAESDWVIPQLPGGPGLRNLIGRAELARMKPSAFIVNVSRPDVVDRAALIEALRSGRLGGFALDPQYEAPGRSDDELLAFDNVILTPHIAAQPRFNALNDIEDLIAGLAKEIAS
jgi:phosphoglycerate dehydrogenase-like enzyme